MLHGLPLFIFPGGFQVRACHVVLLGGFLKVCPNYLQRLCNISLSTGIWFVLSQNSELLMVFGQKILRMCLKQLFMKVCTFFTNTTVVRHVSELYNKTAFMLLLKILILVSFPNSFELQMFLSIIKATLAFWILAFTS